MQKTWDYDCKCKEPHTAVAENGNAVCEICGKIILPKVGKWYTVVFNAPIIADFPEDAQWVGKDVLVVGYEGLDETEPLISTHIFDAKSEKPVSWNFFACMLTPKMLRCSYACPLLEGGEDGIYHCDMTGNKVLPSIDECWIEVFAKKYGKLEDVPETELTDKEEAEKIIHSMKE